MSLPCSTWNKVHFEKKILEIIPQMFHVEQIFYHNENYA